MNCILTQDDCAEIYHALACTHATNLQARIGYDGEKLANGEIYLNKSDAETIHLALKNQRERVLLGAYDTFLGEAKMLGSITFELAEHLGRILAEIGDQGRKLCEALQRRIA